MKIAIETMPPFLMAGVRFFCGRCGPLYYCQIKRSEASGNA
ncbi:hypothetical protein ACFSQ7_08690 [Paenibacillus rhizoplanae]